jgi:hypothetical protein
MKKLSLAAIASAVIIALSILHSASDTSYHAHGNGSGAPGNYTGAPGEGLCTSCHSGSTGALQSGWITSNIPSSGYVPGTVYQITATATNSGTTKFGFQVTPKNSSGTVLGVLAASTGSQIQNGGTHITHNSSGTSGSGSRSWVFNWTAPAAGSGSVTFYGAFNITNNNNSTSGDIIYRSTLTVNQATIISSPTVSDQSRCGAGTVTLTASGGVGYRWYQTATSTTILSTSASFTTPHLTATDSFFVSNFDGTSESIRVKARAIIHTIPTQPTANDVSRCGPGTVTLSASGSGSVQYRWYDALSGGTLLHTGASFTSPSISQTTTYYVEADNGNCQSTRKAVDAVVNPLPDAPLAQNVARCGDGPVTLTASSNHIIRWYTQPSGGTHIAAGASFNTPSLSATTTYYVAAYDGTCFSQRAPVNAIINPLPASPVIADGFRCGPGTLTYMGTGQFTFEWFATPTSVTPIHVGNTFTTPHLAATTTFYVSVNDGTCSSARASFEAIINNDMAAPVALDVERCGNGTVTLTATAQGAIDYRWYDAVAGNPIHTGQTFTTTSLTSTTSYFVDAVGVNCESPQTEVLAIINSIPAGPTAQNEERCGPGEVTLTATGGSNYNWYASPSGGQPVFQGNSFTTPVLSANTNYYVSSFDGACESSLLTVEAIIKAVPAKPSVTLLGGNTLQCSEVGNSYEWMQDGVLLAATTRELTVNADGNYSVAYEGVNGCKSDFSDAYPHVGGGIQSDALNNFKIYPNPATKIIVVEAPANGIGTIIQIMDVLGKTAWKELVLANNLRNEIQLEGLYPGIYFVHLQKASGIRIEKLIIR